MKFRFLLLPFALLFCLSLTAQTTAERAGSRAKNRAENRANSRVDQKVDAAVDDAFNAIGGLFKKKDKKETETSTDEGTPGTPGNAMPGGLFGNAEPWEAYTNPVQFSLTMEVVEVKKNGKREQNAIDMAVTTDRFGIRMRDEAEKEVSRMILNTETGKTTMVTIDKDGKKTGVRMRMPGMRSTMESAVEETTTRYTIEATGERKVIDGYNCEKFIVTDTEEGIVTESWITKEAGMNVQEVFSGMMNMFGAAKQKNPGVTSAMSSAYEGFPIYSISNDGKSTFETRFRAIKAGADKMDKTILDVTGVPVQDIGF